MGQTESTTPLRKTWKPEKLQSKSGRIQGTRADQRVNQNNESTDKAATNLRVKKFRKKEDNFPLINTSNFNVKVGAGFRF